MMRSSSPTNTNSNSNDNNNNNNNSSETTISCQDCGNKAKRDCEHRRCRTCCKTRAFPCPTHVKSTWVPVSRRRQRHHHHHHHQRHHHHFNLPLSLATASTFHHPIITSPSGEGGSFPAEVNSMATFRCIRVASEDNVVEQFAYQTSINVGGHNFKGILYDQGPATAHGGADDAGPSDGGSGSGGGGANLINPHPHHHPPLYSTSFNAFLPGMQFFPHPRP